MKRVFSFFLSLCILLSVTRITAMAEGVTIEALQEKYPHGTYWNGGDPETYTTIPCDHHPDCDYTGGCNCNSFQGLGIQCLGFAYQLATLVYGGNQYLERKPVYSSSALDNLKAGDIVRFRNGTHSIFVTAVDGDIVTYADCNSDHQCVIRWDQTILKSTIAATFTYLDPAPYAWGEGGECDCSKEYDGNYKCIVGGSTLNIRSGHGTSYTVIGSIPDGATVYVSKANGEWAHVYYNGINGYASMEYLELLHSHSYGLFYEEEHPHKEYYKCECGDWYYTGFDGEAEDCPDCQFISCEQNGHSYDDDNDFDCNLCGFIRHIVYTVADGKVTITDYTGSASELKIPAEIEGYPVTAIGFQAFMSCTSIVSVTLPDTVTTISSFAFHGCYSLKSVYYYGTAQQKEAITIGSLNSALTDAEWHFVLCEEGGHSYDGDTDTDCNVCGEVREIVLRLSGDVNSDGVVNNKDFGLLRQFLNNWEVEIDEKNADVNCDGTVNNKDMGLLRQYLNGWDVELK